MEQLSEEREDDQKLQLSAMKKREKGEKSEEKGDEEKGYGTAKWPKVTDKFVLKIQTNV